MEDSFSIVSSASILAPQTLTALRPPLITLPSIISAQVSIPEQPWQYLDFPLLAGMTAMTRRHTYHLGKSHLGKSTAALGLIVLESNRDNIQ